MTYLWPWQHVSSANVHGHRIDVTGACVARVTHVRCCTLTLMLLVHLRPTLLPEGHFLPDLV